MNLREYLEKSELPKKVVARRAGICAASITSVLKGKDIHLSVAARLVEASKGEITFSALAKGVTSPHNRARRKVNTEAPSIS